ncbi:hypothetical protein CRE_25672 [Caenorhabditis remanei]|uniref:Zer-1-like leucine-rich repeats region domain-containing protein n=1 Tax=Caenorhabditis remanei TaxID=31234 RepID=E3MLD6_CAERE|nr:hypothetical protein CRE_25672 [Caenorhabditis remanei]
MDQFKEMVSSGCCSCASRCSSVAIVFILALVILGILAPITLTSMLTSSAQRMPPDSTDLSPYSIRHPKFWPKTDKNHFNNLDGIPMPFLFPPNVSTCSGFGFTCTGAVKMIIPSSKRCDGIKDYQDGFDERIARNVNQYFHAVLTSKKIRRRSMARMSLSACLHVPKRIIIYLRPQGYDQFKCTGNNAYLPISAKWDGVNDCTDGSDEKNCNKCGKQCIKASHVCDGIAQCADRSDEKECDCKSCSGSDKALCEDGTCIKRTQVCDGRKYCTDGMDEENCPEYCSIEAFSTETKQVTCSDEKRFTESEACSGVVESCEQSCSKCHPRLTFTCPAVGGSQKRCIRRSKVCDGINDCDDGADEKNCTPMIECGIENASRRCDGVWDCGDKIDEQNCQQCSSGSIRCAADNKCLPAYTRCNGVAECSGGSDERKGFFEEHNGRNEYDKTSIPYLVRLHTSTTRKLDLSGATVRFSKFWKKNTILLQIDDQIFVDLLHAHAHSIKELDLTNVTGVTDLANAYLYARSTNFPNLTSIRMTSMDLVTGHQPRRKNGIASTQFRSLFMLGEEALAEARGHVDRDGLRSPLSPSSQPSSIQSDQMDDLLPCDQPDNLPLITARAPNVTRLFLPRIPNKRSTVDEEEQNTLVILSKILSPLQKLEVLDLSYWSKTDDMRCLQSLSNTLTCLILYDVPDLYHAISNICHMTEIRILDISQSNRDTGLYPHPVTTLNKMVVSLPHMTHLDISSTNLATQPSS